MSEIIGSFRVNKVKAIGNNIQYTILFTKDRIVFVVTGGQFADIFPSRSTEEKLQQLGQMQFEEMIKLDKRNFQLSSSEIIGMELKESTIGLNSARTGTLTITTGKKEKYDIAPGQDFESCLNIVREAFPNRLTGDPANKISAIEQIQGSNTMSSPIRTADINSSTYAMKLKSRIKSGGTWFFWISGLSVINTILIVTGTNISFLIGLGITQITTVIARVSTPQYSAIAAILTLALVAVFVGLGFAARKGKSWAFITGITLYSLDGILTLALQDWFSAAFHVLALYFLINAAIASFRINKLIKTF